MRNEHARSQSGIVQAGLSSATGAGSRKPYEGQRASCPIRACSSLPTALQRVTELTLLHIEGARRCFYSYLCSY